MKKVLRNLRKQFNYIWIGAQGSGKTLRLIELILAYTQFNPSKRVLILLPDDMEEKFDAIPEIELHEVPTFTGIKKLFAGKKTIEWIRNYYIPDPITLTKQQRAYLKKHPRRFNGLICLDDPGVYIGNNPTHLYEMQGRRRQMNADFISTFPGLRKKVPPSYTGYATHIRLWQTTDTPDEFVKDMAEDLREEFMELYRSVQLEARKNKYHSAQMILRAIHEAA